MGAGLAGLSAARTLHQAGVSFVLLEASDGYGGRVRTDNVDGFLLDRGFQIFLSGVCGSGYREKEGGWGEGRTHLCGPPIGTGL